MCLKRLQRKLIRLNNKGEISIYLSLVFTLIISLFLTVISAARGAALQVLFECATESALLSVFGEYNRELLDKYDVFFIDLSYLSNSPDPRNLEVRLNNYFDDNFHPEKDESFLFYSDFLDVSDTNVSLTGYELASDGLGKPFADQAVKYMSNLIGTDFIEEMTDIIAVYDTYDLEPERYEELKEKLNNTFNSLSYDEKKEWEKTVLKKDMITMINDMTSFELATRVGNLSFESIPISDTLLFRQKEKGTENTGIVFLSPSENILFDEYIMGNLGHYLNQKEESKLKFEAEYIIVGGSLDDSNLQTYLQRLGTVRILADFISLNMASDKVEKIKPVSEAIAAVLLVPDVAITEAILLAWATVESCVDINDLIRGRKVPLIKRSDEIKVSFDGLAGFLSGFLSDSGESSGPDASVQDGIPSIELDYNDYLRIFLFFIPAQVKVYRTMDMIEADLRKSGTGNEYFRFDACADRIRAVFSIETGFDFRFTGEKKYSYFE